MNLVDRSTAEKVAVVGSKMGVKFGMNAILPGSGSLMDFGEAAYDFYQGDIAQGLLNVGFGTLELATLGVFGFYKAVAADVASDAAYEATKELVKDAPELVVKEAWQALNMVDLMKKTLVEETVKYVKKITVKTVVNDVAKTVLSSGGENVLQNAGKSCLKMSAKKTWQVASQETVKHTLNSAGAKAFKATSKEIIQHAQNVTDVMEFAMAAATGVVNYNKSSAETHAPSNTSVLPTLPN